MSSKRRNLIACLLLILAALGLTCAERLSGSDSEAPAMDSTSVTFEMTSEVFESSTTWTAYFEQEEILQESTETVPLDEDPGSPESSQAAPLDEESSSPLNEQTASENETPGHPSRRIFRALLYLASAAAAIAAVFILRQEIPFFGPDGAALLFAAAKLIRLALDAPPLPLSFLLTLAALLCARELWGWIYARFRLSACLIRRAALRCRTPQNALLLYAVWFAAAVSCLCILPFQNALSIDIVVLSCIALAGCLALLCLRNYGTDLHHFEQQLDSFGKGLPVTAKEGAFLEAETQLLEVQTRHEEAVRTAVTSERFKVELISNVSHDLRTPLTSILGYSELLLKEELSESAREQLCCLNQKAGYMRDLVESLFELTKVSSGVMQARKEPIDLIRLLEQTVGLLDDQLTAAGLSVRRHYDSPSVPLVTDGARMHQVFANLLENAIKYALSGTRLYLEVKEKDDSWLVRLVNTSSYEMDFNPEEIMQRFARGDKARSTKGSGLGLAIAKTYTESVGGQFDVAIDGDQFSSIVTLPKTERNL